jgi:hypothetical protein
VRYRGTLGGDISHGDPGNDHPALMLVLGASFVLRSSAGERVVPADGFFVGQLRDAADAGRDPDRDPRPGACAGHRLVLRQAEAQGGDFAHRGGGRHAAHERQQPCARSRSRSPTSGPRAQGTRGRAGARGQAAGRRGHRGRPRAWRWASATPWPISAATSTTRPRWPAR